MPAKKPTIVIELKRAVYEVLLNNGGSFSDLIDDNFLEELAVEIVLAVDETLKEHTGVGLWEK